MAYCKPDTLFRVANHNKGNTHGCRDWNAIQKHVGLISDILDESGGLIPNHDKLHLQLRSWLATKGMTWKPRTSQAAVVHLRCQFITLLALKKARAGMAPRRFPQWQKLMDKLVLAQECTPRQQSRKRARSLTETQPHNASPVRHTDGIQIALSHSTEESKRPQQRNSQPVHSSSPSDPKSHRRHMGPTCTGPGFNAGHDNGCFQGVAPSSGSQTSVHRAVGSSSYFGTLDSLPVALVPQSPSSLCTI